mmetsp:Transcript_73606/g.189860  ORF Transcript_73606/g.189860 Transcript_73606/m.189860 type:complete len:201 (+) Transcript_73606:1215-1817(+)
MSSWMASAGACLIWPCTRPNSSSSATQCLVCTMAITARRIHFGGSFATMEARPVPGSCEVSSSPSLQSSLRSFWALLRVFQTSSTSRAAASASSRACWWWPKRDKRAQYCAPTRAQAMRPARSPDAARSAAMPKADRSFCAAARRCWRREDWEASSMSRSTVSNKAGSSLGLSVAPEDGESDATIGPSSSCGRGLPDDCH